MANISEAFIFSSLASATDISGITIDVCETLVGGTPVVYSGATLRKSTALGATPARSYVLYLPNITERTVVELHDNGNPAAVARLVLNPADGDEAKESTIGAPARASVSADIAALPTVVQISVAVVALGGIGGIITGVVDAGVTVSSSFNPISMEKGEKKVLSYRITQGKTALGVDIPFDLSAYTGKFAVKADLYDSIAKIGPIYGAITAHADDTGTIKSVITFTIPTVTTKAMATFNGGRYSVAIYDIAGSKAVLTPTGGVEFNLMEDILDVA